MSRSRMALAVLLFAALVLPLRPADAGSSLLCTGYSSCAGKGYSHYGYSSKQSTSYWRMYTGTNCTNYVAYRLVKTGGMPNVRPKAGVGNAKDWGKAMSSVTDTTPSVGSVAWWGKTGNHVAYVEKVVSSSEIWVSESNWSGAFDWRRITKSGSGWPDGFIHFTDDDQEITNQSKPTIDGSPAVGTELMAKVGGWTPSGNTHAYRWYADGKAISGATAKRFTPTDDQHAKSLAVTVTASREGYSAGKATSAPVKVRPGVLRATTRPAVTGTAQVEETLTASAGTWSPTGSSYRYQWTVGGRTVSGATARTYTLRPEDVGEPVAARVTAVRAGYADKDATSGPVVPAPAPLSSTVKPSVTGAPTVGTPLKALPGSWSRTGLTYAHQWLVGGKVVPGATAPTFAPRAQDIGSTVAVRVTASRQGYTTVTASSSKTTLVEPGELVAEARPVVTGSARVGSPLSATGGTWSSPEATLSYQWYADKRPIAGATSATFVPTHRQRGAKLRVWVTARQEGYTSATSQSVNTPTIASGRIAVSTSPVVTGKPAYRSVLTVSAVTPTPSGATVRYQWLRDGKVRKGATAPRRRLVAGDVGHKMSVRVTISAPGYTTSTLTTPRVGPARK